MKASCAKMTMTLEWPVVILIDLQKVPFEPIWTSAVGPGFSTPLLRTKGWALNRKHRTVCAQYTTTKWLYIAHNACGDSRSMCQRWAWSGSVHNQRKPEPVLVVSTRHGENSEDNRKSQYSKHLFKSKRVKIRTKDSRIMSNIPLIGWLAISAR